jgi:hypothetical protein
VIYNIWDFRIKNSIVSKPFELKKLGTNIMKDLIDIGVELVCVFTQLFLHWNNLLQNNLDKYDFKKYWNG